MRKSKRKKGDCGEGRGNPHSIDFYPTISVNPITLSDCNCQFSHQSKSGTLQGANTRLNFPPKRPGNDEKTVKT